MTDTITVPVELYHEELHGMKAGKALYEDQQEYVRYEDYQSQAARIAELEGQLTSAVAESHATGFERERWKARAEAAEAEVVMLREAGDALSEQAAHVCLGAALSPAVSIHSSARHLRPLVNAWETARAALQEKPQ